MDSESPAPFSAADIEFIQGFDDNLRRDIASGRDYGGILKTLSNRLKSFRDFGTDGSPWGPIICVPDVRSPTNDQSLLRITGPFPDDYFEVMMDAPQNESEAVRGWSAYMT